MTWNQISSLDVNFQVSVRISWRSTNFTTYVNYVICSHYNFEHCGINNNLKFHNYSWWEKEFWAKTPFLVFLNVLIEIVTQSKSRALFCEDLILTGIAKVGVSFFKPSLNAEKGTLVGPISWFKPLPLVQTAVKKHGQVYSLGEKGIFWWVLIENIEWGVLEKDTGTGYEGANIS